MDSSLQKRLFYRSFNLTLIATALIVSAFSAIDQQAVAQDDKKSTAAVFKRIPWTTSKITGSPDPPSPFRIERTFSNLKFKEPVAISNAPGTERLFVTERGGKIFSFPNDPSCKKPDLFADLGSDIEGLTAVYALAFHPQFEQNRFCYVCMIFKAGDPKGTRVSRFEVSGGETEEEPPRLLPKTEKKIIEWVAGGHNGCCLKFGPDGYLYISTGDATAPSPPDGLKTGQDISDLPSSILRVDVNVDDPKQGYKIPSDNPFVELAGARDEIWAYGFRNPWRMSFDRANGDLWVGDVGWELWEMIFRVEKAGNYGWSVMEGPQPVRTEGERGPTPVLPPTVYHNHYEAASITGGYVYHGDRLHGLKGEYVYGDYVTGKIWSLRHQNGKVTSHRELVDTTLQIIGFGEDNAGELYLLNYGGGEIYRLSPNDSGGLNSKFPSELSKTGLFTSTSKHKLAPGVVPLSINAEQWADNAQAERLLAIPGDASIDARAAKWKFPKDSVLAKTISIEMHRGQPESSRRLETQLLHFDGDAWRGYTYRWNKQQSDAFLVVAGGVEETLTIQDDTAPGGSRDISWRFNSRGQCLMCHNSWTDVRLATTAAQLDRTASPELLSAVTETGGDQTGPFRRSKINQFDLLEELQYLLRGPRKKKAKPTSDVALGSIDLLVDPYDENAELNARARSYLHVNCAHCHRFGGGGTATILLQHDFNLAKMQAVGVRPAQGAFGMHDARIIAPGDPYRSALLYRISKLGSGRMPYIGSQVADEPGLRLLHDWIKQLPQSAATETIANAKIEQTLDPAREAQAAKVAIRLRAEEQNQLQLLTAANQTGKQREAAVEKLLQSTSGGMLLLQAIGQGSLSGGVRESVIARAAKHQTASIRDLFERFIPDDQRVRRLGSVILPGEILKLKGDVARGQKLFMAEAGLQCKSCHKIGKIGSDVGPDLSEIGKRSKPAQLLESILEPSKTIDPKFITHVVETTEGLVLSGLLIERTDKHVLIKDAQNRQHRIANENVELLAPQAKSMMPELLLRDITAQQASDLITYLRSLK